jgi:enoyl-CoA hydratase/carnithine racemase
MADPVESRRDGAVALVTIDNPPVNALSDEVIEALTALAGEIDGDPAVRAVVVAGAGDRSFLAGADLPSLRRAMAVEDGVEEHLSLTVPMFEAWRRLRQPVVAAVAADAVGGGLEFALVADLIVADPRARFGLPEVTLGLIPGAGGTQRLAGRVGATALRMILLGEIVTADEALDLGLIDRLSEEGMAAAAAGELAARIAALPPTAVQNAKRAVRGALEAAIDGGLARERSLFLETAATPDAAEGVAAFVEKRLPRFGRV